MTVLGVIVDDVKHEGAVRFGQIVASWPGGVGDNIPPVILVGEECPFEFPLVLGQEFVAVLPKQRCREFERRAVMHGRFNN